MTAIGSPATTPLRSAWTEWRTVVTPTEHGGWGLTLEPALLGLLIAPSAAGAAIGAELSGVVAPLVTVAAGSLLYALATSRLASRQVRLLVGAVKPASA